MLLCEPEQVLTARPILNLTLDRGSRWVLVKNITYVFGKFAKHGFWGSAFELDTRGHGQFGPSTRSRQQSPMNSARSSVSSRV